MEGSDSSRRPAIIAWVRMVRLHHRLRRELAEHLVRWELSAAQFDILAHLGADEGMTQCELAGHLFVTQGNICQLVDKMEGRGLLNRRQEGRSNRLFLTKKGLTLFNNVVPAQEERIAERFAALTLLEQRDFVHLLHKLDRSSADEVEE